MNNRKEMAQWLIDHDGHCSCLPLEDCANCPLTDMDCGFSHKEEDCIRRVEVCKEALNED